MIRAAIFLLAVSAAFLIVWHVGPKTIADQIGPIGWRFIFVFLLGFPRFFLNTLGWMIFLPKRIAPLRRLYLIKIAGELLTRLTPLHFFGGDTARVLLLEDTDTRSQLAATVIMDRTAITLGGAFFILAGVILGSFLLPLSEGVKIVLTGLMLLVFFVLLFLIAQQKRGMLASGLHLLGFLRILRLLRRDSIIRMESTAARIDATIASYYAKGHGRLMTATALNFAGRLVASAEIYLLFRFLEIPLGFEYAIMFSSISLLLTASLFMIPGTLGVAEGTYGLFFHLLNLAPAMGVSLELSRKINALLWFGFGGILALVLKIPRK